MSGEHPFVTILRSASNSADASGASNATLPTWEGQLATLREIEARTRGDRLFTRGDIVRYIAPAGPIQNATSVCLMFWRALDPTCDDDRHRIRTLNGQILEHLDELDCIVAIFEGTSLVFHLASTSLLERDPRAKSVDTSKL